MRAIMVLVLVSSCGLLTSCGHAAGSSNSSPSETRNLETVSAPPDVPAHPSPVPDRVSERALVNAIARGDEGALARYRAAHDHADGAYAESLDQAVALALPHNPRAVLHLLDLGVPIDTICTSPFIEPKKGIEARYFASVRAALSNLAGDRNLVAERDRCLGNIDRLSRAHD